MDVCSYYVVAIAIKFVFIMLCLPYESKHQYFLSLSFRLQLLRVSELIWQGNNVTEYVASLDSKFY